MLSLVVQCLILMFSVISYHNVISTNDQTRKNKWKVKQEFAYISTPEQIHITFGNKINDIVVVWATRSYTKTPFVQYGTTPADLFHAAADTVRFEISNKDGSKYWHRALLPNLRFGERYYYRTTSENGSRDSDIYSFTTPIVSHGTINSYMVLADMGLQTKSLDFLVYEALNHEYEAVFHVGDITEGLGLKRGLIGDKYLNKIQKMTVSIPYLTCPGDHERFYDFVHYRYRFSMPNTPWPMPKNQLWYSIDIGNAHFVTINTEVFLMAGELMTEQLMWLEKDLTETNKKRMEHPWVIVFGHRPLYSSCHESDIRCKRSTLAVRRHLDDILFKHGVDVYIGGHDHRYERTFPVYNSLHFGSNYKNPMATVHITIGAMGSNVHESRIYSSKHIWSSFVYRETDKELYGRLDIINASHIMWEVFNAENNAQVDRMYVIQWRHGSFGNPGREAYQKSIERQNIPMFPPIPAGYEIKHQRNLKGQGFWESADHALTTVNRDTYTLILSLSPIAILIMLAILCSRRMKRKLLSCCSLCRI